MVSRLIVDYYRDIIYNTGSGEAESCSEGLSCVHLQDPAQLRRITQAVTSTRYCAVLCCTVLIVLYTRSPVLVEFSLYPHLPPGARLGLVLYVGMMPSYKISVRYQTKHHRIELQLHSVFLGQNIVYTSLTS